MAKTKRTTQKKISLAEFKTWLAGVQSMQAADWHPSKENWDMILKQIDNIKETVVEKEMPTQRAAQVDRPAPHSANPALANDPRNPANASVGNLPSSTLLQPRSAPAPAPNIGKPTGDNGGLSVSIPSGDDQYESSFID